MTPDRTLHTATDLRLTRTAGHTGVAGVTRTRTRYATSSTSTALTMRGVRWWRATRAALVAAWSAVRHTLTVAGWLLVAAVTVGLGCGLVYGWLEFVAAGIIAAVLLVLSVPFLFSARSYDVDLTLGHDRVVAGTQVAGILSVVNRGRGIALPGRIDIPVGEGLVDVYVPILRHGHRHEEQVVVPTHRRGVIQVGPARTVRGDPLGILRREATWEDVHTLYVHPVTTALRSTSAGFIRDLEGSASRTVVDADISFHAIREYVPGDAQRQVHWKSTAKTGTLMVRQYEETRRSRMVVALATAEHEYASEEEFELAVSTAASIGVRGIRDGRDVDVVIGAPIPEFARAAVRTSRELTTISARTLLDDLSGVEVGPRVSPLGDVTSLAAETHPDASIAFLVCGSTQTARAIQAAALAFPSDVAVCAIVCNPESEPGMRRLGSVAVLSVGLLDDVRQLLSRGAQA